MLAKLVDGKLVKAPVSIQIDDYNVWNASEEQYIAQGWYPVIYTDAPDTDVRHYAEYSWSQESDCIRQTWTVYEIPEPSDDDEIDDMQVMAVLMGEEL